MWLIYVNCYFKKKKFNLDESFQVGFILYIRNGDCGFFNYVYQGYKCLGMGYLKIYNN